MSSWTSTTYAVLGKAETVRKIDKLLRDTITDGELCRKINQLNAFLVKMGYAGQEDIDALLSKTDREIPSGKLLNFYGEFRDSGQVFYGDNDNAALEFTTDVKWVFDNVGTAIREMYPDVKVFGKYFDEAVAMDVTCNGESYLEITDDKEGEYFRRFEIHKVDGRGVTLEMVRTNDFEEFSRAIERFCGKRPKSQDIRAIDAAVGKTKGIRFFILDLV